MDHGQHFTFCCLGHSDLNSHLKILNTSNTSLTLGEPHTQFPPRLPDVSRNKMYRAEIQNLGPRILPDKEFRLFRDFQVITIAFF